MKAHAKKMTALLLVSMQLASCTNGKSSASEIPAKAVTENPSTHTVNAPEAPAPNPVMIDNGSAKSEEIAALNKKIDELQSLTLAQSNVKAPIDESLHQEIGGIKSLLERIENKDAHKSNFYLKCVQSLDEKDSENTLRNQVMNAMALVNSSKVAKAVEISQHDFSQLSSVPFTDGSLSGYVFVGTIDPMRDVNSSYSFYAFTRLPSFDNLNRLTYRHLSTSNANAENVNAIGYSTESSHEFLLADQESTLRTMSDYELLTLQHPLKAIDANRIESYTKDDCERIATYMANSGSKSLSERVDEPIFRAYNNEATSTEETLGRKIRNKESMNYVVSDGLEWLNRRWENVRTQELRHNYRDEDSKRILVLQDNLMRKSENGHIDYSFLDLIEMPHLRFFAAVDSKIGESRKVETDFDNDFQGKQTALVDFVKRHHFSVDRRDNNYRGLEAVFVQLEQPKVEEEVYTPREARNLFHVPGRK